jgi:hypothetical protein
MLTKIISYKDDLIIRLELDFWLRMNSTALSKCCVKEGKAVSVSGKRGSY